MTFDFPTPLPVQMDFMSVIGQGRETEKGSGGLEVVDEMSAGRGVYNRQDSSRDGRWRGQGWAEEPVPEIKYQRWSIEGSS
jgi:hypothetical protein